MGNERKEATEESSAHSMIAKATITPLYLKEDEIAARVGLPPREWAATAIVLERYGMPRRDALFKDKRCWPAVESFLLERARPRVRSTNSESEGYRGFNTRASKSTSQKPK